MSNQFDFFNDRYIFNAIDKVKHITKINIFVDMFYNVINNYKFVIILKIEKIDFINNLFIVIVVIIVN